MEGYVFNDIESATAALAAVNLIAGYPRENNDIINGGVPATTDTYCNIMVHPDGARWAIYKDHITGSALPQLEAHELDSTWWSEE